MIVLDWIQIHFSNRIFFFFFQRRRAQSASKVVEKMKKRQAELVSFPAAEIQVSLSKLSLISARD